MSEEMAVDETLPTYADLCKRTDANATMAEMLLNCSNRDRSDINMIMTLVNNLLEQHDELVNWMKAQDREINNLRNMVFPW